MNQKKWILWLGIELCCVVVLLGTVLYGEIKDRQTVAQNRWQPSVTKAPQATAAISPTIVISPTAVVPEPTAAISPTVTVEADVALKEEPNKNQEQEESGEATPVPTGSEEQEATEQEETVQEKPTATPTPVPTENRKYAKYDNTTQAWWFRRNTKHEPSGSGEAFDIKPFGAYYLNEQAVEEDKVFYLTFDCGYEMGFTPTILDILKKYEVPVMFFVTQDFVSSHPDYVIRMKEEGHLVGNHTVRHLSTPKLTPQEIQTELATVADTMLELTGYPMDSYFRPPMGEYSERTLQVTKDLGYKTIFWSIAYYDYDMENQPGKDYVLQHFSDYHHNGCIALLHNTSQSNMEALEDVILMLLEEGYRFGSLEELQ